MYLVPETQEPINAHINKDIKIVTLSHNENFRNTAEYWTEGEQTI
jgi:hypothetical protein